MCVNALDPVATTEAIEANVQPLQSVITRQAAAVQDSLELDCSRFDAAGICLSVGARHTETDTAARGSGVTVVAGWRAGAQLRLGAFMDTNHADDTPAGVQARQGTPLYGFFGDWHQDDSGLGAGVRAAISRSSTDLTVSRASIVDNDPRSEPGVGSTRLDGQAASLTVRYGWALSATWRAVPYLGVRHTRLEIDGYTEGLVAGSSFSATSVNYPLTYGGLDTHRTTVLLGVQFSGRTGPSWRWDVDAGLEQDVARRSARYRASGSLGIGGSVDEVRELVAGSSKPRGYAGVGLTWELDQGRSLGVRLAYRPGWFDKSGTVSSQLVYTARF